MPAAVTQQQLLRECWGPSHEDDSHYLRILLGKLRHKLGDSASAPKYLATELGVGYPLPRRNPSVGAHPVRDR